jgi:hypothetical protein
MNSVLFGDEFEKSKDKFGNTEDVALLLPD